VKVFKLTPDEEEKFFENLPRFIFYYLFLFVIFWYGLSTKSAEEIREGILSGKISPGFLHSTLIALLLLALTDAYLARKGTKWNTPRVALFMVIGVVIMLLVVMYIGRASILFVVTLILIYINTFLKVKEESQRKGKKVDRLL